MAEHAVDVAQALHKTKSPNEWVRQLPVRVMASALDVPDDWLDDVTRWTEAFTRGIAAGASRDAIGQADEAAAALHDYWQQRGCSLIQATHRIGLIQQSLDATAALFRQYGGLSAESLRTGGIADPVAGVSPRTGG